jgi:broad specificity phosphatase PhoE
MPSPPELLVVVRHAESARNVAKGAHVFYPDAEARRPLEGIGDHEIGLSAPGEEQARTLGADLRRRFERFDLAIHSGYRRARDTAPDRPVTDAGSSGRNVLHV